MSANYASRPAWAEINLDAVAENVRQVKSLLRPETELMAVVKADGYGHGALPVACTALAAGAKSLAVAFVEEGITLRRAGLKAPVLLLGYTSPARFEELVHHTLTPTIFTLEAAAGFSEQAVAQNKVLPVHLKVDTGMGRVGFLPEQATAAIGQIAQLPGLKIEGIFTHLAMAEEIKSSYTLKQLALFDALLTECAKLGLHFEKVHAASSAAAINYPSSRYNLVRLGLALYGHYPAPALAEQNPKLKLLPAGQFKSRVVMVKEVPQGSAISYDCTYKTTKKSIIATISVGYADGYSRLLSNKGEVLVRGRRLPVIGRVCMDHLMIDATDVPGVSLNDEVVLYGRQGEAEVRVEEMAEKIGTVNYELLCAIDKRVPRFYFKEQMLKGVYDCLSANNLSAGSFLSF